VQEPSRYPERKLLKQIDHVQTSVEHSVQQLLEWLRPLLEHLVVQVLVQLSGALLWDRLEQQSAL
jgi:hypothetical protein